MAKKLREMTDDEVFARWQERFDRILTELHYVFENRRKFRDLQGMFDTNKELKERGSQAWEWLLGHWGRDVVIAVRRELDDDRNTISLGALLDEMSERPQVLARKRYLGFLKPTDDNWLTRNFNEGFDAYGIVKVADTKDDYLDPKGVLQDRRALNDAAAPVLEYANRLTAHRTPVGKLELAVGEVNAALDAIEPVVKKYYPLLTGNSLDGLEPSQMGDDWKDMFLFAWHQRPKRN